MPRQNVAITESLPEPLVQLPVAPTRLAAPTMRKETDKVLQNLKKRILHEHQACQAAMRASVIHAITAGRDLNAAKLYVDYGSWQRWLAENFSRESGLSERTANRYMQLANQVPQLLATLRSEDPSRVSADCSPEEMLANISLRHALRLISEPTTSTTLTTTGTSPTIDKGTLAAGADQSWLDSIAQLLNPLDLVVSDRLVHEFTPATRVVNIDAVTRNVRLLRGNAYLDLAAPKLSTKLLQEVVLAHGVGKLGEVLLHLRAVTFATACPRLAGFSHAYLAPSNTQSRGESPSVLIHLAKPARGDALGEVLSLAAPVFVPWRAAAPISASHPSSGVNCNES